MSKRAFTATVVTGPRGRVFVPLPFAPDDVWGAKDDHHVAGTVGGRRFRGVVERFGDGYGLALGAAWRRDCGIEAGATVAVALEPEGPQRGDLAPDLAAALAANPAAGAFFDSIAQYYRKAYLTWIDGTKRRPEERVRRIAEVVDLLAAGVKQRPQ